MTRFARILLAATLVGALASTAAPAFARSKKHEGGGRSLEQRHAVCLAFIKRHGLSCDPWVQPTCGADTGYFRPLECVRPRSQR